VSSLSVNAGQPEPNDANWARLIPGSTPPVRTDRKKPPRSVKTLPFDIAATSSTERNSSESGLAFLVPSPLQSRMAGEWLKSMTTDWALVSLNWLGLGALLVPLHSWFPHVQSFAYAEGKPISLLGIAMLHAALINLIGHSEGLHRTTSSLRAQTKILAKSIVWATLILCIAYSLQGTPWTMSALFCAAGFLHFGALGMWRWQSEKRFDARGNARNVLIIGASGVGRRVASCVEQHPASGRKIFGFLDDERPLGNGVIGRIADLPRIARKGFIDEIILAAPRDRKLTVQILHEACRLRLDLEIVPDLFGCSPATLEIERAGDLPVISLHAERLPAAGLVLKRIADVLGASLALILLSPLVAAIAALIKLDSRGKIFYCAARAGRKGRLFRCYKFRTMVRNADELKGSLRSINERAGPTFKIARDPRVTRVGRFLRHYSLDELPQFWNVLKGDMSLVGPRPHPLDDFAAYEMEHLARLDVTPGITGLWQVTARRDRSFQRGMELDREYIRTWSLGLDLRILLKTLLVVVQGSGE
jgi:exopolysaccharide biosynthesis polyprenyl glycosylphosphotransferase